MENEFTILIADRNPNVRELLKREMMLEGYKIRLAKDSREVLELVFGREPLDLLILDPDLPDAGEVEIYEKLGDRIPQIPVVLHSFGTDNVNHQKSLIIAALVEKQGNSVEHLKKVVSELLDPELKGHDKY